MQMLFTIVDEKLVPLSPMTERFPNGETCLTIQQAATRFGDSPSTLERVWRATWSDLLPEGDEPATEASLLSESIRDEDATAASTVITSPSPLTRAMQSAKLKLLHSQAYPHLTDEQFEFLIEVAAERRLNLWSRQLVAQVEFDDITKQQRLVIITTIAAFRLIASRTGLWRGTTPPTFCDDSGAWRDVWLEDAPPAIARVGVIRTGFNAPSFGDAHWKEYAPIFPDKDGVPQLHPIWARRKHMQLAKCAEAMAFRLAFPEEFGDIYTRDEMMQRHNPPPAGPADPGRGARARGFEGNSFGINIDDSTPRSRFQLELKLVDMGFNTPEKRRLLIEQFKQRYRADFDGDDVIFYAKVLRDLKQNPRQYGAVIPDDG